MSQVVPNKGDCCWKGIWVNFDESDAHMLVQILMSYLSFGPVDKFILDFQQLGVISLVVTCNPRPLRQMATIQLIMSGASCVRAAGPAAGLHPLI